MNVIETQITLNSALKNTKVTKIIGTTIPDMRGALPLGRQPKNTFFIWMNLQLEDGYQENEKTQRQTGSGGGNELAAFTVKNTNWPSIDSMATKSLPAPHKQACSANQHQLK